MELGTQISSDQVSAGAHWFIDRKAHEPNRDLVNGVAVTVVNVKICSVRCLGNHVASLNNISMPSAVCCAPAKLCLTLFWDTSIEQIVFICTQLMVPYVLGKQATCRVAVCRRGARPRRWHGALDKSWHNLLSPLAHQGAQSSRRQGVASTC